jgi:hypothetical protein
MLTLLSTYQLTRELPAPMQEELPSVEDLQEVVTSSFRDGDLRRNAPDEE